MGFFDDLKVLGADLLAKGSVVAKDAAQKAQDAGEMGRIKVKIMSKEREIKDLYMKIGKAYYEEYKEDAAEFAGDIAEINAKYAAINELNSKFEMYKDAMSAKKQADTQTEDFAEDIEDAIVIAPTDVVETVEEKLE